MISTHYRRSRKQENCFWPWPKTFDGYGGKAVTTGLRDGPEDCEQGEKLQGFWRRRRRKVLIRLWGHSIVIADNHRQVMTVNFRSGNVFIYRIGFQSAAKASSDSSRYRSEHRWYHWQRRSGLWITAVPWTPWTQAAGTAIQHQKQRWSYAQVNSNFLFLIPVCFY